MGHCTNAAQSGREIAWMGEYSNRKYKLADASMLEA